jgi:hypothetical protein
MGGIGDQIFQFGFATYLKKKLNCNVYLDVSYYESKLNYNNFKFRLANLSKKNNLLLINNISYINYSYLSYLRFVDLFKINKIIPWIYNFFFKVPIKFFIYEYWKKKKKTITKVNSYYLGYWHNIKYLRYQKKSINQNMININTNKPKIKRFIDKHINNKTVCLHIRGGDFANLKSHNLLDQEYYDLSINFYKKKLHFPIFHVFTNDLKFSKKILSKHKRNFKFKFIKNLGLSDIEEFSLFSEYKFSIIANSTFSLISTFLSVKRNVSTAPKIWLKGKKLEKEKQFSKLKFI